MEILEFIWPVAALAGMVVASSISLALLAEHVLDKI